MNILRRFMIFLIAFTLRLFMRGNDYHHNDDKQIDNEEIVDSCSANDSMIESVVDWMEQPKFFFD